MAFFLFLVFFSISFPALADSCLFLPADCSYGYYRGGQTDPNVEPSVCTGANGRKAELLFPPTDEFDGSKISLRVPGETQTYLAPLFMFGLNKHVDDLSAEALENNWPRETREKFDLPGCKRKPAS